MMAISPWEVIKNTLFNSADWRSDDVFMSTISSTPTQR